MEKLILLFKNPCLLPEFLFGNGSLVRLEASNGCFMPRWRVNWPSLKSNCHILSNYMYSQGIENVVSGSPLLESLELEGEIVDHVTIVTFVDVRVPDANKILCPKSYGCLLPDQMIENILSGTAFTHSLKLIGCLECETLVIASKSLQVLHLEHVQTTIIEVSCPNLQKVDLVVAMVIFSRR